MRWGHEPPHRPRRLVAAGAAVALVGAAAVVGVHRGAAAGRPAAAGAFPRPPAAGAVRTGASATPGATPLLLPAPRTSAGSAVVPLGFPRGALGAASAAWRWTQVLYGLDPARAAAAAMGCADPTFRGAAARAAQTTLDVRASLGVAATGPASPAYLVVTPRMLRIADPDPDRPILDVLATADLGSAGGTRLHQVQVLELHLHWVANAAGGGGYRLLDRDADPTRVAALTADPDTATAYRLGWRDAVPAEVAR